MEEFEKTFAMIHEQINPNVDYYEFKDMIIAYAEKLMSSFLNGKAQCKCCIKPLKDGHHGSEYYDEESNTFIITISDKDAKSIYDGTNFFNILTLFHEIAHVYDEFNIQNKDFKDANLKKICIERGIINAITVGGELFYKINYNSVAIEAHANLIGAQLIKDFYNRCKIELSGREQRGLLYIQFTSLQKLNNPNRDYSSLFNGFMYNNYKLSLNTIISEIKNRYPNMYNKLAQIVGEEHLDFKEREQLSDFETKVYAEDAILEIGDIIKNPMFMDLIEDKTQHRPKV